MYTILLPAYNEERDIRPLLSRIQQIMQTIGFDYRVFVVNDGSTDNTANVIRDLQKEMPIDLIEHEINKGLGQAMYSGFSRVVAQIQDEDVVVTMDADNTHNPCLIEAMDAQIRKGADLVIASRYETGGKEVGLSPVRSFLSRGASALLSIFFPIQGAKDYTCGYRAYRGSLLKRAFIQYGDRLVEERGFTCMAEILIKMSKVNARVTEVPLVLRYDLKSGQSKMKVMRTILRYFVMIAHNILPRLDQQKGYYPFQT